MRTKTKTTSTTTKTRMKTRTTRKKKTRKKKRSGSNFTSGLSRMRLCLAALILMAVAADGQQHTPAPVSRTIQGSVLDHAGHPVAGAVVLIEDLKSLQIRSYIVQEDGKFRF